MDDIEMSERGGVVVLFSTRIGFLPLLADGTDIFESDGNPTPTQQQQQLYRR